MLNQKTEINCVLLGYFAKVVSSFFSKNKKEICSYFYSNDHHVDRFLHHIYSRSLVDPLKSFLVIFPDDHHYMHDESLSENKANARVTVYNKFYQQRVTIFHNMFLLLEKSEDHDTLCNVQFILETLVAKIDQTVDGNKLLDDVVLRKDNIKILFNCLKSSVKQRRKAAADIMILIFSLLMNEPVEEPEKRNTMMSTANQASPEFAKAFEQRRKDEKNVLFQTFIDELDDVLAGISKRRSSERAFNNSIGKEVRVIDQGDIRILQLIQSALKFNLENINLVIAHSNYFDLFFVIFKNSGWNSTIHTLFNELIKACLNMMGKSPQLALKVQFKFNSSWRRTTVW